MYLTISVQSTRVCFLFSSCDCELWPSFTIPNQYALCSLACQLLWPFSRQRGGGGAKKIRPSKKFLSRVSADLANSCPSSWKQKCVLLNQICCRLYGGAYCLAGLPKFCPREREKTGEGKKRMREREMKKKFTIGSFLSKTIGGAFSQAWAFRLNSPTIDSPTKKIRIRADFLGREGMEAYVL